MVDTVKPTSSSSRDDIRSRVQSAVGDASGRMREAAHDTVENIRINRPALGYIGVGLLVIGAGFGIWALLRSRESEYEPEANYETSFDRNDFRRSQY